MTVVAGHRELVHMSWDTIIPLEAALQMLTIYQLAQTRAPTEQERTLQATPQNVTDATVADAMMAAARAIVAQTEVQREKLREDRESINRPEATERMSVNGTALVPLTPKSVKRLVKRGHHRDGVRSIPGASSIAGGAH